MTVEEDVHGVEMESDDGSHTDEIKEESVTQKEGCKMEDTREGMMDEGKESLGVEMVQDGCGQTHEGFTIEGVTEERATDEESQESCLLQLMVKVSVVYIHISLEQFNGFICKLGRQVYCTDGFLVSSSVCMHCNHMLFLLYALKSHSLSLCTCTQEICETFEGILKIISLVKSILTELHGRSKVLNSGIISLLSDAEDLGSAIYDSCVKLIRHIVSQAETFFSALSPQHKEKGSKEVCY